MPEGISLVFAVIFVVSFLTIGIIGVWWCKRNIRR